MDAKKAYLRYYKRITDILRRFKPSQQRQELYDVVESFEKLATNLAMFVNDSNVEDVAEVLGKLLEVREATVRVALDISPCMYCNAMTGSTTVCPFCEEPIV
jgi:recombinational DNA repair protein RecR